MSSLARLRRLAPALLPVVFAAHLAVSQQPAPPPAPTNPPASFPQPSPAARPPRQPISELPPEAYKSFVEQLKSSQRTHLEAIPAGLTLPIAIDQTLRAGRTPVGTRVTALTLQRILLPGNHFLPDHLHLAGTVTVSTSSPAALALRFTTLSLGGKSVPLSAHALAGANFYTVTLTRDPINGFSDRMNSDPANWTTQQVGGDQVSRSGWSGPVVNTNTEVIGLADYNGIYAFPAPPATTPRALGPFSSTSTGLAGYDTDCTLQPPAPTVTAAIQCTKSPLTLHSGDAFLLEITSPLTPPTP